jgi:hypothetical protein
LDEEEKDLALEEKKKKGYKYTLNNLNKEFIIFTLSKFIPNIYDT